MLVGGLAYVAVADRIEFCACALQAVMYLLTAVDQLLMLARPGPCKPLIRQGSPKLTLNQPIIVVNTHKSAFTLGW